ncbi:MAG: hypothetical protein ABSF43_11925 [Rectinemataceae bacterium]
MDEARIGARFRVLAEEDCGLRVEIRRPRKGEIPREAEKAAAFCEIESELILR